MPDDAQKTAEMWALANDENFRHLLLWRLVKARAERGGFNGPLIHDYRTVDAVMEMLTDA